MRFGLIYGRQSCRENAQVQAMVAALERGGHECVALARDCHEVSLQTPSDRESHEAVIAKGCCDMIISIGGDGTFLSVAPSAAECGIPVVGVNYGRMGFLSENTPESVAQALLAGDYSIEDRRLLCAKSAQGECIALNEVAVSRASSAMLGINVSVDGKTLPTYWADGLLVATASGSTAYSLSVGGPIVLPSSNVLIIAPVAPHNLNVRPLVVPAESTIDISFCSRHPKVNVAADNNHWEVDSESAIEVKVARFSLKRVCLKNSNFIKALSDKLFWGEDIRNEKEI